MGKLQGYSSGCSPIPPPDRLASQPLHQQVYERLRDAILAGNFPPGSRLPSSRTLANHMGISRNTVLAAFEQLYAEGYIEGQHGSGTYISEALPDEFLQTERLKRIPEPVHGEPGNLSQRGHTIVNTPRTPLPALTNRTHQRAFTIGLPDLGAFPHDVWTSLVNRRLRQSSWELMRYGHPGGYAPLRKAIAARLAATRGVLCSPEQVIVVTGSQQALDFCARLLLDPGDPALVEDPGYLGARAALMAAGAELIPVPIDAEGLDIAPVLEKSPTARLAVVTPSYQFPLGVTMSLSRRLSLLDWASRIGAWVVEDDYDAEFRYVGRPRAALQGIDRQDRVIYVGTFSKSLFPGLRLGYLVPPSSLVDAFLAAHLSTDIHAHVLQQAVLADFIEGGHLDRHLRRMRTRYAERQGLLVEAAQSKLDGLLELNPADAGLHLIGWLKPSLEDSLVAKTAATKGVDVWPLSLHAINPYPRQAILLGYARPNSVRDSHRYGSPPPRDRSATSNLGADFDQWNGSQYACAKRYRMIHLRVAQQ